MHQVQVNIVQTELRQRVLDTLLDLLGAMEGTPQLGGHENVLALEVVLLEAITDGTTDSFLIAVLTKAKNKHDLAYLCPWNTYGPGGVNVTVARGKGGLDGGVGLFIGRLPGTKA